MPATLDEVIEFAKKNPSPTKEQLLEADITRTRFNKVKAMYAADITASGTKPESTTKTDTPAGASNASRSKNTHN